MSDFSAFDTKYVLLVFNVLRTELFPSCKVQLNRIALQVHLHITFVSYGGQNEQRLFLSLIAV